MLFFFLCFAFSKNLKKIFGTSNAFHLWSYIHTNHELAFCFTKIDLEKIVELTL